jgi:hypothetical protein
MHFVQAFPDGKPRISLARTLSPKPNQAPKTPVFAILKQLASFWPSGFPGPVFILLLGFCLLANISMCFVKCPRFLKVSDD